MVNELKKHKSEWDLLKISDGFATDKSAIMNK